jgi:hypothetical protein
MDANTTYADLLEVLKTMSPNELQQTATVFVRGVDEYYPIQTFDKTKVSDVLDKGHFFMLV